MNVDQVRRRLRLHSLDMLAAVARTGSMRKAAEALHYSQPAISKAIMELEADFGVALLDRSPRGVELTRHGQALLSRSERMFDELQQGVRELEQLSDPEGGEAQVGCMETLNAGLVGVAVERVSLRHPRARFAMLSGESPHLMEHFLAKRLCDFLVARPYDPVLPAEMVGLPLYRDQLHAVVGRDHPLAKRRRVGLAGLIDANWILSTNEAKADSPIGAAFRAAGLPMPVTRVITGSLNMRYNLLATGRYVTCIPHSLLHFMRDRRDLKILPLELPLWRTPTMVIRLKDRVLAPLAERLIETVVELARPLAR